MTRSKTPADLAGRCPQCWVVQPFCICAALGRSENRTEVVFVRHHWEVHKSTGTARIAALVLARSRIVELGYDSRLCDAVLEAIDGAWLLYPGGAPGLPEGPRPERLMVIDGTWAQSRRMLRRLPALQRLPRISLPAPPGSPPLVLRKSPHAAGHSTILAVAGALGLLEGPEVGAPLEQASRLHTERVLLARYGPNKSPFGSPLPP